MLSLIPLTILALTSLPTTLADQAVINATNSALSSQLSSLSSLFTAKPSSSAQTTDRFCCSDECPPGACNINHIVPTDLAYAFPAPSSTSNGPSTSLTLPCCGPNCPDGACRTTLVKASMRPSATAPPRMGQSSDIIIGCCPTCQDCEQVVTSLPSETLSAAAREAEITPSPSLDDAVTSTHPNEKFPHGPFFPDICIGCGKCTPCDHAFVRTLVDFMPAPTGNGLIASATATDDSGFAATTTAPSGARADEASPDAAESTIYVAPEVVDSINGLNQDTLPIILQSGAPAGILNAITGSTSGKGDLRTLLASVDLKLSENYISRRLLSHLGRIGDVTPYPKGLAQSTAIMNPALARVTVNETVVMDIVAGDDTSVTRKIFRHVRFNVFGEVNDEFTTEGVGEVVLGSRVLREMGGLSVFEGFRGEVQRGVRVVEVVKEGKVVRGDGSGAGTSSEKFRKHDEL